MRRLLPAAALALLSAMLSAAALGQAVLPANGISIWNSEGGAVTFALGDDGTTWDLYSLDAGENRSFPHRPFFGIRRGNEQVVYRLEPGRRYRIFYDTTLQAWDLRLRTIE